MLSYPACKINAVDEQLNVLQITDMHLTTPTTLEATTALREDQSQCQQHFDSSLKQALAEDIRCDLILVTGDLVSKVDPLTYDYIFDALKKTQIPFACIAGNHDVTDELGYDLPFDQRQLIARSMDSRLLNQHVIESEYWQLLLLDSSVSGKISGVLANADLDWLCQQLDNCDKPALLALHHHVLPMNSEWIDAHMVENAEEFWQRIDRYEQLRVIISGHTHQEQIRHKNGVTVYSTPSTCYQFLPNKDEFSYDEQASAGYRWLQLANNGNLASWVKRLDT
ncbi:metallophosphoesterase [Psychrobacter sp. AH5]|uniref:metallophosphoesterase n=1 Tax=Psychrobacter sp. AH5 TaxID=2937433 RepID=UPI003340B69B